MINKYIHYSLLIPLHYLQINNSTNHKTTIFLVHQNKELGIIRNDLHISIDLAHSFLTSCIVPKVTKRVDIWCIPIGEDYCDLALGRYIQYHNHYRDFLYFVIWLKLLYRYEPSSQSSFRSFECLHGLHPTCSLLFLFLLRNFYSMVVVVVVLLYKWQ